MLYDHARYAIQQMYTDPFSFILGKSACIQNTKIRIQQLVESDVILICGESGTGKELAARAIHQLRASSDDRGRSKRPFLPLNSTSFNAEIVTNELFGHVGGAFTGALKHKQGLFALVDHGSVFLDEIGDMPLATQGSLLRFLDSGEIRQIGSCNVDYVDAQVISATSRDLWQEVKAGKFREDLFYRLHGSILHMPPLRDHLFDIRELSDHFLDLYTRRKNRKAVTVSDDAYKILMSYWWPGNVRELKMVIECAMTFARKDEYTIKSSHLGFFVSRRRVETQCSQSTEKEWK